MPFVKAVKHSGVKTDTEDTHMSTHIILISCTKFKIRILYNNAAHLSGAPGFTPGF
jgi:hypothetical protein